MGDSEPAGRKIRVAFAVHTEGFPVPRLRNLVMTEEELERLWEHLDRTGGAHRGAAPNEVSLGMGMNRGYVISVSPEDRRIVDDRGLANWINSALGNDRGI